MIRHTHRWFYAAFVIALLLSSSAIAGVTASGIIGVDQVHSLYPNIDGVDDLTGNVQRVAIVDTGIDWSHPALAGRVVAGVNYAAGASWGSEAPSAYMDQHGHGTFVSGLVASNQPGMMGVAPNVELVAVRVLASNGQGSFSDVATGLQWVNDHAAELNITAVNLSLGTTNTYASPEAVPSLSTYNQLHDQLIALEQKDIVTVVSAGNGSSSTGLSVPAIYDEVVSVGSSTVTDRVSATSNRNASLEALAPGEGIQSLWVDGGYSYGSGTSYAAPYVTAAAVLTRDMIDHQAWVQAGAQADLDGEFDSYQDRFTDLIQSTGVDVYDAASDYTYDRLDLFAALTALDPNPPSVPEPASLIMIGAGMLMMTHRRSRMIG